MAVLTGAKIREEIASGAIVIDPYNPERVQSNSIDLTLGSEVRVYSAGVTNALGGRSDSNSWELSLYLNSYDRSNERIPVVLDARSDNPTYLFGIDESGWVLKPDILYLMHTHERICSNKYLPCLDGKSSIGRLGITVHVTAGLGDTGFDGQYTLEVHCVHPVKIYAGMPICQMRFNTIEGEVEDYKKRGHYTGQAAMGAVPSQSWRQK